MEPQDPLPVWRVMVRVRWIAALVLALVVAAIFGALSQWQINRAVETATVIDYQSETVTPLTDLAEPMAPLTTEAGGHRVSAEVTFVPGDEVVVGPRHDRHEQGYWVISHAVLTDEDAAGHPVALAVARGWSPDPAAAHEAAERLAGEGEHPLTVTGRLMPAESPDSAADDAAADRTRAPLREVSPAYLVNVWHSMEGVDTFNAYVISDEPTAGLEQIYAPPPAEDRSLNWLNIFYAVEWVVFAGFAVFLWYRLVKDATERENELAAENAQTQAAQAKDADGRPARDADAPAHEPPSVKP